MVHGGGGVGLWLRQCARMWQGVALDTIENGCVCWHYVASYDQTTVPVQSPVAQDP